MEHLFSTNIRINNQEIAYQVYFSQEQYVFTPDTVGKEVSSFSFKRENDEWHDMQALPHSLKKQAIDALENYLLAQH